MIGGEVLYWMAAGGALSQLARYAWDHRDQLVDWTVRRFAADTHLSHVRTTPVAPSVRVLPRPFDQDRRP